MSFWKDFKAFAMRGNVIDLAVGVVIGAAFGKIVTAMVDDMVMPLIGMLTSKGQTFTDKFYVLKPAKEGDVYASLDQARKAGANVFAYGHFLQTVLDFLIIAFCIFLAIKAISRMYKKEEPPAVKPTHNPTELLLTEIRDLLKEEKKV